MKKYLFLSIVSVLCIGFSACGDDEDTTPQKEQPTPPTPQIVPEDSTVVVTPVGQAPQSVQSIDLGLPSGTLWASCNVGSEQPEQPGDYFAWGETSGYTGGKETFTWENYLLCKGTKNSITKYTASDGLKELSLADDAAWMNWGGEWRTPSKEQLEELINTEYTAMTYISEGEKKGWQVTSRANGNSIFLPLSGYRYDDKLDAGYNGSYWSRTLGAGFSAEGLGLYAGSFNISMYERRVGQTVRAVAFKQP